MLLTVFYLARFQYDSMFFSYCKNRVISQFRDNSIDIYNFEILIKTVYLIQEKVFCYTEFKG